MAKKPPSPKRTNYDYIPRRYSRTMPKRRFVREVLGGMLGGSVKRSLDPLKRKDVRAILEQADVYDTLADPNKKKLTERESVEIVEKTRKAIRKNLLEKGYGLHEQGPFRGKDPKRIYEVSVEKFYSQEGDQAKKREDALETQVRKARRRELVRKEMGLSTLQKLVQDEESRREKTEKRLGAATPSSRADKHHPAPPQTPGSTPPSSTKAQSPSAARPWHIAQPIAPSFDRAPTKNSPDEDELPEAPPGPGAEEQTQTDDDVSAVNQEQGSEDARTDDDTPTPKDSSIEQNLPL